MEDDIRTLVIVGFSGSLGAICRYLLYEFGDRSFNLSSIHHTILVNIVGVFLLAVLASFEIQHSSYLREYRDPILTGFLGAFTTFSAFIDNLTSLGEFGSPDREFAILSLGLILTLLAATLGVKLAETLNDRRRRTSSCLPEVPP